MLKELLVGLAFALSIALLFAAVSSAGALLDMLVGFSFGSIVDPLTGNQSAVLTQLYGLVALAVFVAIDGSSWMICGLARTYDLVPLTAAPDVSIARRRRRRDVRDDLLLRLAGRRAGAARASSSPTSRSAS